jgi:hypothetical protein
MQMRHPVLKCCACIRLKAEDNQQQLAEELSRQTETHVKSFRAHAEKREKVHIRRRERIGR